jgi:hypothetical protein
MPTLRALFSQIKTIHYTSPHLKVEHTVADELRSALSPKPKCDLLRSWRRRRNGKSCRHQ